MSEGTQRRILPRTVVAGALTLGLIGGGYGIANAASDTTTATATPVASTTAATPTLPALGAAPTAQGFGGQRSDETVLAGDVLASVTKAATAKVPGATIVRVETDTDGNATYEAHMTTAAGSRTTVYVDKSFNVVSVDSD